MTDETDQRYVKRIKSRNTRVTADFKNLLVKKKKKFLVQFSVY